MRLGESTVFTPDPHSFENDCSNSFGINKCLNLTFSSNLRKPGTFHGFYCITLLGLTKHYLLLSHNIYLQELQFKSYFIQIS